MTDSYGYFLKYFEKVTDLYNLYNQGAQEMADYEESKLTNKDAREPKKVRTARLIGKQRWARTEKAKSIVDDQKLAERQEQVHANLVMIELLEDLVDNTRGILQKLEEKE